MCMRRVRERVSGVVATLCSSCMQSQFKNKRLCTNSLRLVKVGSLSHVSHMPVSRTIFAVRNSGQQWVMLLYLAGNLLL